MFEDLLNKGLGSIPKKQVAHTVLDYLWGAGEKYFEDIKVRNGLLRQKAEAEAKEREEIREILRVLSEKYT